jgi:hypothetical protein
MTNFPREINYIWRYGNATSLDDELKPTDARPEVIHYIKRRFEKLSYRNNGKRIVEKTCANSLRVEFVQCVFPKAQFVHLVRDGRAVAESAKRCWQMRPRVLYLFEKALWVPFKDIPYYGIRYLRYQVKRYYSKECAQGSWGPRFRSMDNLMRHKTLIEVCGIQWKTCVRNAELGLQKLPSKQVITLRYEDLVNDPSEIMGSVFEKLGLEFTPSCLEFIEKEVCKEYQEKWRDNLSRDDLRLLIPHICTELRKFGYEL